MGEHYPRWMYRGPADKYEAKIAADPDEEKAAAGDGWRRTIHIEAVAVPEPEPDAEPAPKAKKNGKKDAE